MIEQPGRNELPGPIVVENKLVQFLKSRLPGEKTKRQLEFYDRMTDHLPQNTAQVAETIRPIVKKSMYIGNVVGTYYEVMLLASLGLGTIALGKEGLRMVPTEDGKMKRKGLAGVWKDLNLGSVPHSAQEAISEPVQWSVSNELSTLHDLVIKRNREKAPTAKTIQLVTDRVRENPNATLSGNLFTDTLVNAMQRPFSRTDGQRGYSGELARAADLFYLQNPDHPATEALRRLYKTLADTAPKLDKQAAITFCATIGGMFGSYKHINSYSPELLLITLERTRKLLSSRLTQAQRSSLKLSLEQLKEVQQGTWNYGITYDPETYYGVPGSDPDLLYTRRVPFE